ncbi:class I SAM-dependent methyltransferase [Nocardioides sp. KIGAM211]|uniref:Class I SAM-dependent methyltransferase n=1 Tax=Nocardioides luti TaxID=2761101 RepID=A0A7X0RG17_9ACTN|nr:class I SAM-dependent methyltransferase [Nocardioides luti]MBB6627637.1 class I SAM-dependent methyltransferase [Nocardioides luti]
MSDENPAWASSFGSVADAYDRGRPSYPREAAAWLVGPDPVTVLELGCGTGKLTEQLVALGHDVHATDPDAAMLAVLAKRLPDVRSTQASAEEIPMADGSVDVVVCAQAFHWFDLDRALPEIARVLKPGGRLALVWNWRDERIPWVRRLGRLIGTQDQSPEPQEPLVTSSLFGFVESELFRFWQLIDRSSIQDLVLSRSNVAVLDAEGRAAKLAEVVAFYDDFGRGMDGMQLPYEARCFRAVVVDRPRTVGADEPDEPAGPGTPGDGDGGEETQPLNRSDLRDGRDVSDGTDTDMLLIDFR